jgi:hypothetical protein
MILSSVELVFRILRQEMDQGVRNKTLLSARGGGSILDSFTFENGNMPFFLS